MIRKMILVNNQIRQKKVGVSRKFEKEICNGNLDPYSLAEQQHYNCRKPKEEIAKALHGNNREDFLFGLKQEYESYKFFQRKIKACDKEIE